MIGAPAVPPRARFWCRRGRELAAFELGSGRQIWSADLGEGAGLAIGLTGTTVVVSRTGPSAGLVGLVHDASGSLTAIESPTVLKPGLLLGAWAIAAIPIAAILLFAGRALTARLGPVGPIGTVEDDVDPVDDDEDEDAGDDA
jgi:hypothetical protein